MVLIMSFPPFILLKPIASPTWTAEFYLWEETLSPAYLPKLAPVPGPSHNGKPLMLHWFPPERSTSVDSLKSSANSNHHFKRHFLSRSPRKSETAFNWKWRMISCNSPSLNELDGWNVRKGGLSKHCHSKTKWVLASSQSAFLNAWNISILQVQASQVKQQRTKWRQAALTKECTSMSTNLRIFYQFSLEESWLQAENKDQDA